MSWCEATELVHSTFRQIQICPAFSSRWTLVLIFDSFGGKQLPFRHSDSRVICFGFPVSRLLKLWARQHNAAKRLFRLTAEASFQFQCSFGRQSRAVNPLV